jgi:hypothetical protein
MTSSGDFPGDMEEFPFDDTDADAVFGSSPGSESVPAELRDVAELVHVARGPGAAGELAGEDVMVAQIAAAVGEHLAPQRGDADERIRVLRKFRTVKLTAAATAVLMLGATAAAAATGTLPAPVQSSVDKSLSGVGIDLPAHHHAELTGTHETPKGLTKALHRGHHPGAKQKGTEHTGTKPAGAAGTVASVNGSSASTACGVAMTAGLFTVTGRKGATFTVNVTGATTFFEQGVTSGSFANVCVGDITFAKGDRTGMTVAATKVFVSTPRPPHAPAGAFGTVASVNGSSSSTACGVAMTAGLFTVTGHKGATFTVNVTGATTFVERGMAGASFATVCVGVTVFAKGTVTGTTVDATNVAIAKARHEEAHHHGVFGTVVSVNGVSTAGACGMGTNGAFTVTGMKGATFSVNVDTSTKFRAFGIEAASFVNVCVGAKVGVEGDVSGATVTAAGVFVLPVHPPAGHDGNGSHQGRHHFPKGFVPNGNQSHGTEHKGGDDHHGRGPSGTHKG